MKRKADQLSTDAFSNLSEDVIMREIITRVLSPHFHAITFNGKGYLGVNDLQITVRDWLGEFMGVKSFLSPLPLIDDTKYDDIFHPFIYVQEDDHTIIWGGDVGLAHLYCKLSLVSKQFKRIMHKIFYTDTDNLREIFHNIMTIYTEPYEEKPSFKWLKFHDDNNKNKSDTKTVVCKLSGNTRNSKQYFDEIMSHWASNDFASDREITLHFKGDDPTQGFYVDINK
jgi:hypothetical protein